MKRRREHRRDRRSHDERGALLRRRRRHLRHRRAGHQGPVHEERRHHELPPLELAAPPATACCSRRWPISSASRSPSTPTSPSRRELAPKFSYGCAVFLDTDRVNFQKEGFSKEELLAGLAQVLPKNVWQYVVQIPRLASLGTQVRPPGRHAVQPRGRQGAGRLHQGARPGRRGLRPPAHRRGRRDRRRDGDAPRRQAQGQARPSSGSMRRSPSSTRRRTTRRRVCHFCPNECKRTFIDTKTPGRPDEPLHLRLLLREGHRRDRRRRCSRSSPSARRSAKQFPNLVDYEAKRAFRHFYEPAPHARRRLARSRTSRSRRASSGSAASRSRGPSSARSAESQQLRRRTRIGIPRVLNLYSTAPFFRTYFEALGIPKQNVVFSDETTEEMWVEGGKYGSIDPCYPSKVAQAHIHNLLFHQHTEKKPLKYIFFPIITHVPTFVERHDGQRELPDRRRRARRHEGGLHEGGRLLRRRAASSTSTRRVTFIEPNLMAQRHVRDLGPAPRHHRGRERLRLPRGAGRRSRSFENDLQDKGRAILETVEAENRVAILMLGRPYHSDPGLNHGIPEEFQVLGYPDPVDPLDPEGRASTSIATSRRSSRAGQIEAPLELNDVWPENYSANSAQKVWAREVRGAPPERRRASTSRASSAATTRRPTASSTPSSRQSKTPYAALHDIDANKPGGSIKIRVKTYAHALKLHEERLEDVAQEGATSLEHAIDKKRLELLELKAKQLERRARAGPGARSRRSRRFARSSRRTCRTPAARWSPSPHRRAS